MSSYTCMQRGRNLAKQVAVYTEKTLRRVGGRMYKVAELIIHPRRDEKTKAFDQALLRLEKSIQVSDRAQPICLPTSLASPSPGSQVMVSGWGSVNPTLSRQGRDAHMFLHIWEKYHVFSFEYTFSQLVCIPVKGPQKNFSLSGWKSFLWRKGRVVLFSTFFCFILFTF